uniref:Acyl-CoA binding protein n=1 Tax=Rhizophora mucronata TaxID=61149 RepID=A0A2P2M889_RHIMU
MKLMPLVCLHLQGLIMLLQCMQNVTFLSSAGGHMLLVSMIYMCLICKLWNGLDQHNKGKYQLHELDMLVQQLGKIGLLLAEVTTKVVSQKLLSSTCLHLFGLL